MAYAQITSVSTNSSTLPSQTLGPNTTSTIAGFGATPLASLIPPSGVDLLPHGYSEPCSNFLTVRVTTNFLDAAGDPVYQVWASLQISLINLIVTWVLSANVGGVPNAPLVYLTSGEFDLPTGNAVNNPIPVGLSGRVLGSFRLNDYDPTYPPDSILFRFLMAREDKNCIDNALSGTYEAFPGITLDQVNMVGFQYDFSAGTANLLGMIPLTVDPPSCVAPFSSAACQP